MYCAEELERENRKQYMRDLNFRIEENYRKAVESNNFVSYDFEKDEWSSAKYRKEKEYELKEFERKEKERKEKEYKQNVKETLFNTDWEAELRRAKIIDERVEKVLCDFEVEKGYPIRCTSLKKEGSNHPDFGTANQLAEFYGVELCDVLLNAFEGRTEYKTVMEEKESLERLYYSWQ